MMCAFGRRKPLSACGPLLIVPSMRHMLYPGTVSNDGAVEPLAAGPRSSLAAG